MRGSYCTTRKNATCTSSGVRDSPWPAVSTSKMLCFPSQCSLFSQRSCLVWPKWAFPIYLWLKASNTLYHSLPIIQSYLHRADFFVCVRFFGGGRSGWGYCFCFVCPFPPASYSSSSLIIISGSSSMYLHQLLGTWKINYWPIVQI